MEKFLAVQVEHTRYVRLLRLDRPGKRELPLTTLADNQKQADIKLFLIEEGHKIPLHTFTLTGLPRKKAGEPRIVLDSSFNGRSTVRLRLILDGKEKENRAISLKKYLKRVFPASLLLPALLMLLVGAAALFLSLRMCGLPGDRIPEDRPPADSLSHEMSPPTSPARPLPVPPSEGDTGGTHAAESKKEAGEEKGPVGLEEKTIEEKWVGEVSTPVFTLETQVYFQPDTARLTDAAKKSLDKTADLLKEHPEVRVGIYGHCALYGTEKGRIELSMQRAEQVVEYLRSRGWKPEHEALVQALGGSRPVTRDSDSQHLNRRVEIIVPPPDKNNSSRQDR